MPPINQSNAKIPDWIRVKAPVSKEYQRLNSLVQKLRLNTVCQSAACPNIGECWTKKHATFMIMGDICTRQCKFCNIKHGKPDALDQDEPERVASAVAVLGLRHVVITSVDRDDLADGGAEHFFHTITQIRLKNPNTTIEVLTPDFLGKKTAIKFILDAKPDVFNHNIETVKRLYSTIKGSSYKGAMTLLKNIKSEDPEIFTKSGIILGMGETDEEVVSAMKDLRDHDVDFLTISQYLRPSEKNIPVDRFIPPEQFVEFEKIAYDIGFKMVFSGPLVRSSYHADDKFEELKNACRT